MDGPNRKVLLQEIAQEKARLADLDRQREETRTRLKSLLERLVPTCELQSSPTVTRIRVHGAESVSAEEVALFRGLFRGRQDVFPKLWVNAKKGTKGYAPACANEWIRGVCEKPKVKCGECPNQAFLSVEDTVIIDHLVGRHVTGVYPLWQDDTC